MAFGGGAPRSLLEYAKVAKENQYDVLAAGQYTYIPDFYHKYQIRTYNVPYFVIARPLRNIMALIKYVKVLKKNNLI